MKKKYYIGINNGVITQDKTNQNAGYIIYADDQEIQQVRNELENMQDASLKSFVRAHIPIMPYHNDASNDQYDAGLSNLFQLLYELGDTQTKEHIESLNIFS
ncbi:hydrolase [Oceanobacillus sp. CAU 1775]